MSMLEWEEEENSMKKRNKVIAFLVLFLVIFAWLLTSFQIVIYGDSSYGFYQKEYEKYQVTEDLEMQMEDVMQVTVYMMDYLIGKEEVLSIETDVGGKVQDFFNEQDRLHMADVRNLFLGGLKLRNICIVAAVAGLVLLILSKDAWQRLIRRAYLWVLAVSAVLAVLLLIAFAVDFTASFTVFHEIFFTNDLWLFDPATDYMIRMLPEGFFYDMTMRIGSVFCIGVAVLGLALLVWGMWEKRNKKN